MRSQLCLWKEEWSSSFRGQFDFNTRPSSNNMYYKPSGRREVNRTYGAPMYARNQNFKVEHDNFGRVRRVGNVFINYDANDRIKRIGLSTWLITVSLNR
jgi:hypothetical protein